MAFRQSTYWWVKPGSQTGKQTNLQTVDKWICEWFDDSVHPKYYSQPYNTAVDLAHAALMNLGGGHTEQKHIDYMLKVIADNKSMPRREKALYSGFFSDLFTKWQLHACG